MNSCILCNIKPIKHPKSSLCHSCWVKEWRRKNPKRAKFIEQRSNNKPEKKLYARLWQRQKSRDTYIENKNSTSYIGKHFEKIACTLLKNAHCVDKEFEKPHSFDIFWEGKKVDVKSSIPHNIKGKKAKVFKFHLRRKDHTDYFFLICRKGLAPTKAYLIPSDKITSKDIGIGETKSKFDIYLFPF